MGYMIQCPGCQQEVEYTPMSPKCPNCHINLYRILLKEYEKRKDAADQGDPLINEYKSNWVKHPRRKVSAEKGWRPMVIRATNLMYYKTQAIAIAEQTSMNYVVNRALKLFFQQYERTHGPIAPLEEKYCPRAVPREYPRKPKGSKIPPPPLSAPMIDPPEEPKNQAKSKKKSPEEVMAEIDNNVRN